MADIFNLTDTWNAGATVFSAIKMNVTDTASNFVSTLIDLQVGGVSFFNIRKDGSVTVGGNNVLSLGSFCSMAPGAGGIVGVSLSNNYGFGWGASNSSFNSPDTAMMRDGVGIVGFRVGTVAQAVNVYNTFTDASNYERAALDWLTTANTLTLGTQKLGTGTTRGISMVTGGTAALSVTTGQAVLAVSPTGGLGYGTGAGGAVTQITSRTTGVTLNKVCGGITLFNAAGSAVYASFTVTNSTIAATDVVRVIQQSGTNKYIILVTAVAAGSFEITFATTGGVAADSPVFNFAVVKAVAA